MRKNLTHIYVSHFHPDHHFGLGVLQNAFPSAKIVALPSVVNDIAFTSIDKIDMWSIDRFGPDIPTKTTIPMPLHEPRLELEGEELLFSDDWEGDSINNSVVWPRPSEWCARPTSLFMTATCGRSRQRRATGEMEGRDQQAHGLRPSDRHPRASRRGKLRILEQVHDDTSALTPIASIGR